MSPNEFKGYDKPHFDGRVKLLLQIENIHQLLRRLAVVLAISVVFGLMFSIAARAADIPNLFLVPVVTLTPEGASVFQPQTGDGYQALNGVKATTFGKTLSAEGNSQLDSFNMGKYVPPKYDAFAPGSMNAQIPLPEQKISNVDQVDFSIDNNLPGSRDESYGTTQTTFTFSGRAATTNIPRGSLQYRWDFQNDGVLDSYFSTVNSITHIYPEPGEYQVKLEVLDQYGRISAVVKNVHIARNDTPTAYFQVNRISAPRNSIFRFDTSLSTDNQYSKDNLVYRFDWDGDGQYETNFQNKTIWNHLFVEAGKYQVIMQVRDPEGLTARAQITITISDDNPPKALLSVMNLANGRFKFDASHSSDDFTPLKRLKFRWDFNYTGLNDIVFDSNWSNSPEQIGNYRLGGEKTVRLQVMDEQGFIDETFAKITVPWTQDYLNLAVDSLMGR